MESAALVGRLLCYSFGSMRTSLLSILPIAFFVAVLCYLIRDELRRVLTTKKLLTGPITTEDAIAFITVALIFFVATHFIAAP
jgi:hypothetical protein